MQSRCKTCGGGLVERLTKQSASRLNKPYYYKAYYFCPRCQKIYHDEKFKVVNKGLFSSAESTGTASSQTPSNSPFSGGDHSSREREHYDVKIWTDGACVFNGTPRARAAWAFVSDERAQAGLVPGLKQTNNVAEGLAILHALEWAAGKGYKKILLSTDSQISLHNLKKPAAMVKENRDIFERIERVIGDNQLKVSYEKVLGHSGDKNNERADMLANQLAKLGSSE